LDAKNHCPETMYHSVFEMLTAGPRRSTLPHPSVGNLVVTKAVQYPSSMYPAVADRLVVTKVVQYPSSMYLAVADRLVVTKVMQYPSSMYQAVADRLVVTKVVQYPSSMYSAVADRLVVTKVVQYPSSMYSTVADRLRLFAYNFAKPGQCVETTYPSVFERIIAASNPTLPFRWGWRKTKRTDGTTYYENAQTGEIQFCSGQSSVVAAVAKGPQNSMYPSVYIRLLENDWPMMARPGAVPKTMYAAVHDLLDPSTNPVAVAYPSTMYQSVADRIIYHEPRDSKPGVCVETMYVSVFDKLDAKNHCPETMYHSVFEMLTAGPRRSTLPHPSVAVEDLKKKNAELQRKASLGSHGLHSNIYAGHAKKHKGRRYSQDKHQSPVEDFDLIDVGGGEMKHEGVSFLHFSFAEDFPKHKQLPPCFIS